MIPKKIHRYQRKQYVIDKNFQIKTVAKVYGGILLTIIILGFLIFDFISQRLSYISYEQFTDIRQNKDLVLPVIIGTCIGLAGTSLIFITWTVIRISHRIAGPIYHFKRVISDIRNGNLTTFVKLRPNDEFRDFAAEFNEMILFYRVRLNQCKTETENILTQAKTLSASLAESEKKILEEKIITPLEKIRENLVNLKT